MSGTDEKEIQHFEKKLLNSKGPSKMLVSMKWVDFRFGVFVFNHCSFHPGFSPHELRKLAINLPYKRYIFATNFWNFRFRQCYICIIYGEYRLVASSTL